MANILGGNKGKGVSSRRPSMPERITAATKATFLDLLSNTPGRIRENATNPSCSSKFMGVVRKPNGLATFVWRTGCSGRNHLTTLEILPGGKPERVPIKVQCSCEYYVYNLEVVMAESGLSENRYALPQWPIIRNPNGSKHLCKHMVLVADKFATKAVRESRGAKDQGLSQQKLLKDMDTNYRSSRRAVRR